MMNQQEFSCGLSKWRPAFLQKFATIKYFMIVYGLLGTIQAMSFVYFIATLTTLEKRFQIRSEITGILMSGNEMSQILLSIILAYRGGKGNRPVWIAWGVLFSSLSCFILALPHFIYGPGANALALTEEFFDYKVLNSTSGSSTDLNPMLCSSNNLRYNREECKEEKLEKPLLSLCLIFFSQFVLGVGTTLYVTLGQPFLDDNSKKKNAPLLLGLTMALRTAGPAGGFILGFICLNLYIDPSLVPIIDRSDPRWLGAWWLGWVILGMVMTVFSFLIASFPRQLRPSTLKPTTAPPENCLYESVKLDKTKTDTNVENSDFEVVLMKNQPVRKEHEDVGIFTGINPIMSYSPQIGEDIKENGQLASVLNFKQALRRVCGNSLLICNIFTAVFYILGGSGYINFYTKYSETQFHQSAASSSMIAGVTTVISMVVGFMASGFVISKFKPGAPKLLLFNIFIAVIYMTGEFVFMYMGCDEDTLQGELTSDGMYNPNFECNFNCSCNFISYSPVCFEKGKQTFFSACHAGCTQINDVAQISYTNCTCLPDPRDVVKQGPCKVNCTANFIVFVAVQCLIQLLGCSGRITNVLINYRSVEPRDKPLAQGIALFMISLLAFIPGPIIYGRVIDNTCVIWDNKCGKRGNCWVYNKETFRRYLNTTALCFTFGAFIFDIVVYFLGKNIKLYEETPSSEKT